MTLEQKKKEIAKLELQQMKAIEKCANIAQLKPSKNTNTQIRRIGKAFEFMMEAKALQVQKMLIASQPTDESISKLKSGGISFKK